MDEPQVVVPVTIHPKRKLRDWRLWAAITACVGALIVGIAMWVLYDSRNEAKQQVENLSSTQACYRTAAADTTAASARVQVDLADFVVAAIEEDGEAVRALAKPLADNADLLRQAVARQQDALDHCQVGSDP
jgi:hypothetical protein